MGQYELFPRAAWQDLPLSVLYYIHTNETMPGDHSHTFYELVLVREGGAFHFMNDETVPIRAGNVFLVPPGKIHGYRDTEHLGIYNILFSAKILDTFKHDLSNTPNYQMLFHLQPELFSNMRTKTEMLTLDHGHFTRVVTLADEIMGEEKRKESGGRTVAFGEFLHLIGYIIRHAHIAGSSEKTSVYQISRLLAELDRNCAREWSLESMAAFVRMSQEQFPPAVPFDDGNGADHLSASPAASEGGFSAAPFRKDRRCGDACRFSGYELFHAPVPRLLRVQSARIQASI